MGTFDDPDIFCVYYDTSEIGQDGYPYLWHHGIVGEQDALKDAVRDRDGHRCLRCKHPFIVRSGMGRWSPCDPECTHGGPVRFRAVGEEDCCWSYASADNAMVAPAGGSLYDYGPDGAWVQRWEQDAEWRILTVHHLNGMKHDCRWWNLVSLCQRCHLTIQAKVHMDRPYVRPHSDWFKVFAAAFYAWKYLDIELGITETADRLDELLALELRQDALW